MGRGRALRGGPLPAVPGLQNVEVLTPTFETTIAPFNDVAEVMGEELQRYNPLMKATIELADGTIFNVGQLL